MKRATLPAYCIMISFRTRHRLKGRHLKCYLIGFEIHPAKCFIKCVPRGGSILSLGPFSSIHSSRKTCRSHKCWEQTSGQSEGRDYNPISEDN